ncbi:MAG: hypothetical protein HY721_13040 [Planctomycetes bacterium]|nr:hypothetical protein [Planctomycetota bacterium]
MRGELTPAGDKLLFKASATGQLFVLAEHPDWKDKKEPSPFQKLQAAIKAGGKLDGVSGRVEDPEVPKGKPRPIATLYVIGFEESAGTSE